MATITDPWPKRSGSKEHPADGMTLQVALGDGAFATIIDPRSFTDGGLEWALRYGDPETVRYAAAGVAESYDYLLSSEITMTEATRRLRELRRVRALAAKGADA